MGYQIRRNCQKQIVIGANYNTFSIVCCLIYTRLVYQLKTKNVTSVAILVIIDLMLRTKLLYDLNFFSQTIISDVYIITPSDALITIIYLKKYDIYPYLKQ